MTACKRHHISLPKEEQLSSFLAMGKQNLKRLMQAKKFKLKDVAKSTQLAT